VPVAPSALRLTVARVRSSPAKVALRLTCSATCVATVTVRRAGRVITRRAVRLVGGRATIMHLARPARGRARPAVSIGAATADGRRSPTRTLPL
jgi:hypothetical protein